MQGWFLNGAKALPCLKIKQEGSNGAGIWDYILVPNRVYPLEEFPYILLILYHAGRQVYGVHSLYSAYSAKEFE